MNAGLGVALKGVDLLKSDNPIVQSAIQVLDQLADLGKTLPYVAPAFIFLKFIVGVEIKARDADAKCNDLVERITFMLGHLSVLSRIEVTEPTMRVVEQMNDTLKVAASLIQAYRKQGAVARRINVGNKDKFVSCADAIAKCTSDLMLSLQIQQTGKLDILTRGVPLDAKDRVAENFLARHGGADAVKADQNLLAQFAQQLRLKVDEDSMQQLNSNITSLMQQNQAELERIIGGNVNSAVVDGIKGLAAQMNEAEKEQVFKCVQCEKDFRASTLR